MTRKQRVLWALLPAIALAVVGWMTIRSHDSRVSQIGGILLSPGLFLGLLLQGRGGPVGVVVGAVFGWAFVNYLLLCIIQPLAKAIKRHRR